MRSREERNIREKLAHHMAMLKLILNAADGYIHPRLASIEAARLTQTRKARKTIWKTKRLRRMTTEQVARKLARDVKAMPADEKAKLRTRLTREFGPVAQGLADAARRVAREEAAMAKPPITDKIN
jgi:hypothetical protein